MKLRHLRQLALALALASPLALDAAKGQLIEKSVEVPRDTRVALDITYGKAALTWVESNNDPKDTDVEEAKRKDPGDHTFVILRFHYRNDDYVKHKVKLRAYLLDENDTILGEAGRSGGLDPGKADDTISFPMKVKTLDWPRATKLKVTAAFQD